MLIMMIQYAQSSAALSVPPLSLFSPGGSGLTDNPDTRIQDALFWIPEAAARE